MDFETQSPAFERFIGKGTEVYNLSDVADLNFKKLQARDIAQNYEPPYLFQFVSIFNHSKIVRKQVIVFQSIKMCFFRESIEFPKSR